MFFRSWGGDMSPLSPLGSVPVTTPQTVWIVAASVAQSRCIKLKNSCGDGYEKNRRESFCCKIWF